MCIHIIKHKPTNEILPLVFSDELEASVEIEMLCRLYNTLLTDNELRKEHLIFYSKKVFAQAIFNRLLILEPKIEDFEIVKYEEASVTKQLKLLLHKKLESLFS